MRSNWQKTSLGEVCAFVNRGISPKYCDDGGISVLNQKCIRNHALHFSLARRHDITAKAVPQPRLIQAGDVLVNSTGVGTLGRVAQVRAAPTEATTVDSHITIVRPREGMFFPDFFGYMLIAIEDEIKESGAGCGGQTELARATLANQFTVSFPTSISEQQRIVAKLDEAFAAIAKAKENAEKNVANARAIFESELNAIFSKKGQGWIECTIGNSLKTRSGDFLPAKAMNSMGSIDVYGGNGMVGKHDRSNRSGENIIIGRVGAKCGNVHYATGDIWVTDNAFYISEYMQDFHLPFLALALERKKLRSMARQAAQPVISYATIKEAKLEFPKKKEEQQNIASKVAELTRNIDDLEDVYERKLTEIDALKQCLLHHAFTGKL